MLVKIEGKKGGLRTKYWTKRAYEKKVLISA